MPDLIRHPVSSWIPVPAPDPDPGFAAMTALGYLIAGVIRPSSTERNEGNLDKVSVYPKLILASRETAQKSWEIISTDLWLQPGPEFDWSPL